MKDETRSLISQLDDIIEELKANETVTGFDDDGLETIQTIEYLAKKYSYIINSRESN